MKEKFAELMSPVTSWWQSISTRERRLVSVGVGLFIVGFVYWGIFQPLNERAEQAQTRLNSEKQLLQWVTNSANNIVALRAQGGVQGSKRNVPMRQVITSTTSRFDIELIRMQSRDDALQVWVEPLPFNSLISWIAELKTQYGLQVQFLDIDRDDKQGVVKVNRLQFSRG